MDIKKTQCRRFDYVDYGMFTDFSINRGTILINFYLSYTGCPGQRYQKITLNELGIKKQEFS